MKKFILILFTLFSTEVIYSQSISLLGYGGALTGSDVFPLANEVHVKGDWCYGAGLEFGLPFGAITFTWTGQQTTVESQGLVSGSRTTTDSPINYYQLGFEKNLKDGPVRPHTIFTLGAAQFVPQGANASGDQWFFAATFGLGVKADLNEKIALRIQAKGNLPLEMGGAGVFCSFGGCAPNVYFNPILFQGEFTAGLAFKLK